MPGIIVVDSYSHLFGQAVLEQHHTDLQEEVLAILRRTVVLQASKASLEKTKKGKIVWSGRDFNVPLGQAFKDGGWKKRKLYFPGQSRYFIDVDY